MSDRCACKGWTGVFSRALDPPVTLSLPYTPMTDIKPEMLDRELKKGSAELMILSVLESHAAAWLRDQPADRDALGRAAEVPGRVAVSAALPARGARLAAGPVGREGRPAAAAVLPADRRGTARAGAAARDLEIVRRRACGSLPERTMPDWRSRHPRRGWRRCASSPAREAEIIDELAQHLDDRYQELRARRRERCRSAAGSRSRSCREPDTLARQMRALRQAPCRRRSPPGAPRAAPARRTCGRICATPPACCASSRASPPPSS